MPDVIKPEESSILTTKMERLKAEKKSATELQERKWLPWDDNYLLYRNKVKTNRLTQRQAVNIPLMKETIKTLLSKIDDMPEIEWKELSGDEEKELYFQEVWNDRVKKNKFELIDILDKKNVLLYGISTRKLNLDENGVCISVLDPYDVSFDPMMNPWDLNSARYILHSNIFRSVKEILADPKYSDEGKEQLKIWSISEPGITQSERNKEIWEAKMERLKAMGVMNSEFKLFAGGDRIVNLTEHCTLEWDETAQEFEKHVVTYADDKIELLDKTLEELIGVDFWPYILWSEDPETSEIYPDSVADLVRVPNKVLNVWFSQLIENRTLKNFQMHWYSPVQGYAPQTYTPGPGMMLPAPPGEDISKVIMPVEISGLDDTFQAIEVLTNIVERGTGATAVEKGEAQPGQQTLGEIKILVGKSAERTTAMAKFYKMAWYELATKWYRLMDANPPKMLKLHKLGRNGKSYAKTITRSDWKSDAGYEPIVRSSSEQEVEKTKTVQQFMFILSQFPNNEPLRKIAQKRMLEIVDLSPEELRQVEEGEKAPVSANPQIDPTKPGASEQGQPQSPEDLNPQIDQLASLMQ